MQVASDRKSAEKKDARTRCLVNSVYDASFSNTEASSSNAFGRTSGSILTKTALRSCKQMNRLVCQGPDRLSNSLASCRRHGSMWISDADPVITGTHWHSCAYDAWYLCKILWSFNFATSHVDRVSVKKFVALWLEIWWIWGSGNSFLKFKRHAVEWRLLHRKLHSLAIAKCIHCKKFSASGVSLLPIMIIRFRFLRFKAGR